MVIVGAGGHGKIVAELIELNESHVSCFIDQDASLKKVLKYPVVHTFPKKSLVAIVAIGNNLIRKKIVLENNYQYPVLIHPKTCISKRTTIGEGTVVVGGATINIDANIGKHVIVNTNASVGHDCVVGNFVHIAPNVALAGNVVVGEGTHIGIGSAVIQGVSIGKWCVIGAGTVVINDIPDDAIVVGNPARVINIQAIDAIPHM